MTTRTKTGLQILQVSAVIGVLGNVLLRQTPWGLNAFLFVTAFVVGLGLLTRLNRPELLTKSNLALSAAMVFFASMFLIRDAEELLVWDTFAILVIMGVMLLGNLEIKANVAGAFHYAAGFVWSGITSAFAPFVLLGSDIDWKQMPGNNFSKQLFAVLRGLAIALPLLLIFGGLFMAADAVFEGMVNRAFNFESDRVVSHFVLTAVFAWLTAGYLRGSLIVPLMPSVPKQETATSEIPKDEPRAEAAVKESEPEPSTFVAKVVAEPGEEATTLPNNATVLEHINISDPPNETDIANTETALMSETQVVSGITYKKRDWQNLDSAKLPAVFTLGTVETVIILGLVDLLFLAFVAVQVPYLFGGMDLVQNTPDFKLADYARRGFGELVAVAALVLPMLLLSHWLLRKDGSKVGGIYKILAAVQIALLFVVMASAVQRLILLTGELGYGMTTVRFYPMVLMTWLAVVFIWFAATVLRNHRNYFAWGALWSAIFILGATNLMNPDAFIARTNLKLMERGRDFDVYYNARLSDDAIPVLINNFEKLNSDDALTFLSEFQWRACKTKDETDLRSWNLSRREAAEIFTSVGIKAKNCGLYHGD